MTCYLTLVEDRLKKLDEWTVKQVSLVENSRADALAKKFATLLIRETVMLSVYIQSQSSITLKQVCSIVEADPDWMHDIVKYL